MVVDSGKTVKRKLFGEVDRALRRSMLGIVSARPRLASIARRSGRSTLEMLEARRRSAVATVEMLEARRRSAVAAAWREQRAVPTSGQRIRKAARRRRRW